MQLENYRSVTVFIDIAGQTRYRFRRKGLSGYLPGVPGSPEFEAAYSALDAGQLPPRKPTKAALRATSKIPSKVQRPAPAPVLLMPGAVRPKSFAAAYRALKETRRWKEQHSEDTRQQYACGIELFLLYPVDPEKATGDRDADALLPCWRDQLVSDFRRKHINMLLEDTGIAPHARKHRFLMIRKLIRTAMDLEWIDYDVSVGIEYNPPKSRGDLRWTAEHHEKFRAAHAIGTPARTCYELARWIGARRGDIAKLRWSDLVTRDYLDEVTGEYVCETGFEFVMEKGDHRRRQNGHDSKVLFVALTPDLEAALEPLDRTTETVLVSTLGTPYRKESLTDIMKRAWRRDAGLPRGLTLHGLRHALGAAMADAGVDVKGRMLALGHDNPKYAELYSKGAEQARGQIKAIRRVQSLEAARRQAKLRRVV